MGEFLLAWQLHLVMSQHNFNKVHISITQASQKHGNLPRYVLSYIYFFIITNKIKN